VEVGYEVAKNLNAEFSLIVTRKLPMPENLEAGFGAVAEDGSSYIYKEAARMYPQKTQEKIIAGQKEEVQRRIKVLRNGKPFPDIKDRTVILVDDGIAMGSTIIASIKMCRNKEAGKIVVGTPVTAKSTARNIGELVEDIIVLETPPFFRAVAQVYRNWHDVPDKEVISIMKEAGVF
jgi:putative phosphoribosyl transferase